MAEEEDDLGLGDVCRVWSSEVLARTSKLLLVEGMEAVPCWGFFPVEVFLCDILQLATLMKPS